MGCELLYDGSELKSAKCTKTLCHTSVISWIFYHCSDDFWATEDGTVPYTCKAQNITVVVWKLRQSQLTGFFSMSLNHL